MSDVPALLGLVEGAYRGDSARQGWTHEADLLYGQRTDAYELTTILSDPARRMILAEDDGGIIACIQVANEGDGLAYLGMLSISPTRQSGGLGGQMLDAAETLVIEFFGARRMRMTVIQQRHELIAWYERRGYVRTGATEPFPMDDPKFGLPTRRDLVFVVLEKPLTAV